ncbi:ORF6N domain-containing protein [Xylanibacter oryzae]|uniref:ORF6N domain-containing protein n=1 Tax=Xylanibacter oryzae TaxID=185293 RepID=UPI0004B49C41|nr:ORF6N domain-containing protein [Xylanibacter oryzae]
MNENKNNKAEIQPVANCDQMAIEKSIGSFILTIRGQQVILDRDLASLYKVETGRINEQVKRNIKRFPADFMFQLNDDEFQNLKSQFAISNWGGVRKLPYAFTEQGIAMLSSVLRSDVAIEVNIRIMRAFVSMRHFIAGNAQVFKRLEDIEYHQKESDKRIEEIFQKFDVKESVNQGIFYDGQVFDAYVFVSDLIKKAKTSIVLIDNYIDESVLTMLDKRERNVAATIYTGKISRQLQLDITRHNAQYPPITVNEFRNSHDRFLIIDDEVYHIGASIKDLGKKWFGFALMRDITAMEIINRINGVH